MRERSISPCIARETAPLPIRYVLRVVRGLSSEYDNFLVNGPITSLTDSEKGMDGTVKHFISGATGVTNPERVCDYIEDRYGNRTTLSYNDVSFPGSVTRKLLDTVTDPSGRTLTFTWTNLGSTGSPAYRITQVDGPRYTVTYAYYTNSMDAASYLNLHTVTLDPSGINRTTTFTYTSYSDMGGTENGLLASVADPLSHTISYTYGLSDITNTVWVASVTEPAGIDTSSAVRTQTWTITPLAVFGSVLGTDYINEDGQEVYVFMDTSLRTVGLMPHLTGAPASWSVFTLSYDSANNVLTKSTHIPVTDALISGDAWRTDNFTYGPHGNELTHFVDGYTGTTTTTYFNASQYFQKESVTDQLGNVTTFGVGTSTDSTVGNRGSILWVRDAGYSVSGSPSYHKETDYTYNSNGQKTSETNMNGVVTNYTYGDTWGNLTEVVQDPHVTMGDSHLNRTTSMTYNSAGNVTQTTNPLGQTSTYSYNLLGQPTEVDFPSTSSTSAETVNYTYGSNGRMASVADNRGTTSLSYESGSDRVSSVTDPVTGTISYTYTRSGARASMTLPGSGTWTYTYENPQGTNPAAISKDDPNSVALRLSSITDDQGRIVEYQFYDDGQLESAKFNETFLSGSLVSYCQTDNYCEHVTSSSTNSRGLLKEIKNRYFWKDMSGTWHNSVLTQNDYTYNNACMRTANQISDSGGVVRTESYGYDEIFRLTSVNYGDSHTQSYTFDAMGNRATKVNDGTTESYTYNNANMLTARGGSSYTNDINGNTLTGGGRTNTWDSQNRLYQCVNGSTTTVNTYASDGIRHRSASTTSGVTTTRDSVLDASMMVREQTPSGGSEVNVATYLVGPRGPEYRRDDSTGTIRWYCYDGLGSVLGEVDTTGTLSRTQSYDVYGNVRTSAGTSTSKHKFVGSLGHPSEDETGLIYMRARYMDPVTGRFIKEDSAQSGLNWFSYCSSDPVNGVDPDGKSKVRLDLFLLGITAAGCAYANLLLAAFTCMPGFVAAAVAFAITAAAYFVAAFLGGGDVYKVASGGLTFGAAIAEKFLEPMFKKMLTDTVVGFIDTTRFDIAPLASAIGKVFVYTIAQIGALAACDFF